MPNRRTEGDPDPLTALLRHRTLVAENPDAWLPWNYEKALAAAVGAEDDLETRAA